VAFPQRIALFVSGSGSNAQRIMEHFSNSSVGEVALLLSNKADAYALERAKNFNVPTLVFNRDTFYNTQEVLKALQEKKIDLIVLAGFLWLVPDYLINAFPQRIVNIHPALLPKFGGKGMYGHFVHEAVVASGEKESGITIHFANTHYDEGDVIFQASCPVTPQDTPEQVAKNVLALEHRHFPIVIEDLLKKNS